MDEPNIKTLNEVLKGEHMAIYAYESVMGTIDDGQIREELNEILKDHKQHAMDIIDRIVELKGEVKSDPGLVGDMAKIRLKIEGLLKDDKRMIENLMEGEKKGIKMVERIIEGDLDEFSSAIIKEIVEQDYAHLNKLEELITYSKIKH